MILLRKKQKGNAVAILLAAILAGVVYTIYEMEGDSASLFGESESTETVAMESESPGPVGKHKMDLALPLDEISVPVFDTVTMPMVREEVFETEIDGLVGWRVSINGEQSVIYTTDDGEYGFLGMIVGPNGKNVTEAHVIERIGKMDLQQPSVAETPVERKGLDGNEAMKAVKLAPFSYTQGTGPTDIYVTFDPRCPYCHRYDEALSEIHDKVTIHWIPIAVLGPQSDKQAQMLADAADPLELHQRIMKGEVASSSAPVTDHAIETILGNTRIALAAGLNMTPVTVGQTSNGPVALPGAISPQKVLAIFAGSN